MMAGELMQALALPAIGVALLLLGWNLQLRRQMRQQARQLVAEREQLSAIVDGVGG